MPCRNETRTSNIPVVLAHGIRQIGSKLQMEPLARELEAHGIPTHYANYGYVFIPTTNEKAIRALQNAVRDGEDLAAYSNSCWAAVVAAERGLKIRHLFLISPALKVDTVYPDNIETITVFYTPSDPVTPWAKAWRQMVNLLPHRWRNPHGWGEMGTKGPKTTDPRVRAIKLKHPVKHGWNKHWETVRNIAVAIFRVRK